MAQQVRKRKRFLHRDMTIVEKIILLLLAILMCVTTYFVLPISRVSQIVVSGVNDVNAEEVVKASQVVPNQTILSTWFLENQIKERLKQSFLRIDTIDLTIQGNNVYHIGIKEYETIATVELGRDYYSVLASGVVLQENNDKYIGSVPTFKWQGTIETLNIAAVEFAKVPDVLRKQVSEIVYNEKDKLVMTLFMNDGNQVKVNYTDFAKKFSYYDSMKKIVDGKKGIVDLTVGAYFVPYSE